MTAIEERIFQESHVPLILIVDDTWANREILADHIDLLGYRCAQAGNGVEALEQIQKEAPDLILLDMMLPVMDGSELLGHLQRAPALERIPVVVISGLDDAQTMVGCVEHGASDYLLKPINPAMLRARISNGLSKYQLHQREIALRELTERYNKDLERHVAQQVKQIADAQLCTIFALSTLAESRDPETGAHLERMREYCRVLATALLHLPNFAGLIGAQFVENIYSASPLHDIGKVGIPDNVLTKPGRLTDEEFAIMKNHCLIGANTLRRVSSQFPDNAFVQMGIEIAESHHERWDGLGYPHGLSGTDIPLSSRVLALCDVYDALTSKRCYKEPFTHERSVSIIAEGRGTQFDPDIVDVFLDIADEFDLIRERLQEDHQPGQLAAT
jgi:putative two-component system response regulator